MTITRPAEAPAVPAKTTRDVLLHAALLIEERGWIQYAWENPTGLCASGAVALAAGLEPGCLIAQSPFKGAIQVFERTTGQLFIGYNDTPGRSAAEVVAALRAAADAS